MASIYINCTILQVHEASGLHHALDESTSEVYEDSESEEGLKSEEDSESEEGSESEEDSESETNSESETDSESEDSSETLNKSVKKPKKMEDSNSAIKIAVQELENCKSEFSDDSFEMCVGEAGNIADDESLIIKSPTKKRKRNRKPKLSTQ